MKNGFDFTGPWDWEALEAYATRSGGLEELSQLKKLLSPEDSHFLLQQLSRLDQPAEIQKLSEYQRMQEEWGGSFYGLLPDQLTDEEIPVPTDFPALVKTAILLAEVRDRNLQALKRINPDYPLAFTGQPFPSLAVMHPPASWRLELDLSAVREVLRLLQKDGASLEEAAAVATLPAFREMIRHRRELGYLPEPLITEEGLAQLLQRAASRAPLDMIWKWLNPQNFFDLADVFLHREEYDALVRTLEAHAEGIARQVLGTIGQYATKELREMPFRERVSFTVGWGIAGWATAATGGINIEHFKDDHRRLLTTLTHETVHRWQLRVCPADPAIGGRAPSFEDLTRWPLANDRDRKFYEVISCIFLEGTATLIAPSHPPTDREGSVRQGAEMLRVCFQAIYRRRDLQEADELLNEGLKSNGPFYWFGAHVAEKITAQHGDAELGRTLLEGSPAFFTRYLSVETDARLHLGREIEAKVRDLSRWLGREAGHSSRFQTWKSE